MNTIPSLILFTIFIITKVTRVNNQFVRGPDEGTWTEALVYCNENEDGLAVITSATENAAAIAACNTPSSHTAGCYTGLVVADTTGSQTNCKWAWYDDTPVGYGFTDGVDATVPNPSVWSTNEPNVCLTQNHMAMEIGGNSGWFDIGGTYHVSGTYPFPLCKELMPTNSPTSATSNPTTTATNNPTTATNNPTTATNNPTAATNNPTTATNNPTTATNNPTATTNNPTNNPTAATNNPTNNPTAATNNPTTATNNPTAATNNPTTATNNPTAATNNPTATTNNPTAATNNPTAATNNPTTATNNPTTATNNPTATTNNPTKSPTDCPKCDCDSNNPTTATNNPTTATNNPTATTNNPTNNPTDSNSNSDDSDDNVNAVTDNNVFDEGENYLKDIHSNDTNKNIIFSMSEATVINLWLIFLVIIGIIFAFYCHYQCKSRN